MTTATPVMYLAHEDWSPRYENTFYTVKMEGFELKTSILPEEEAEARVGGKTHLPAYYYRIHVFSGRSKRTIFRRYSQFQALYRHLPPQQIHNGQSIIHLPPGTCFCQPQDDTFAENRAEQLYEFLRDLLARPENASHSSVDAFLELHQLVGR